ncbi:MAG: M1 family peptidase, partial [Bacteroidota bacterium]|nr:M1 family peptidase [Bacteroidota bacterium]
MIRNLLILTLLFPWVPSLTAQTLFTNATQKKAYQNQTRSPDGSPGKKYWQNRGNYLIHVSFDPVTHLLSGRETITYFNESPDTLR